MTLHEASEILGKSVNHISNKLRSLKVKPIGKVKIEWKHTKLVNDYNEEDILNLWKKV